jgi:hypothetical protein
VSVSSAGRYGTVRHRYPTLVVAAVGVALGALYLLTTPHNADLAAQTAREQLFNRSGFVPYWAGWYAGASTINYSLTTPPLLGWLGAAWLGGLTILAAALLSARLMRGTRRPRLAAIALTGGVAMNVFCGRTTFAIGAVAAIAAVLAVERGRPWWSVVGAVVATVTSPVAGVLLGVPAVATVLAGKEGRRRAALSALVGIGLALAVIAVGSRGSSSGYEPFTRRSLLMAVGTVLVLVVSPVGRRWRLAGVVALLLLFGCFFIHSAVGANATRIALLLPAAAVLAAARWPKPLLVVAVVLAELLPISQLHNDLVHSGGAQTTAAFTAPLRVELATQSLAVGHRVELVDTSLHWPSTYLLPTVMLARGWERQIDESANPEFYGRAPLTAATYRSFLDRNAVAFVAVPRGVPLDYGVTREAALIRQGLAYLSPVWSNHDWRLYAVANPMPIVAAPATVVAHSDTGVTVSAPRPGRYRLRLKWSPYLVVSGGDLSHGPGDDTTVSVSTAGLHRVHAVWNAG